MNNYHLIGKITAVENKKEELQNYLLEAAQFLQNHPECIQYIIGIDKDDNNAVFVDEIWVNRKAHQDSLKLSGIVEIIKKARPIIASISQLKELEVVGGKGV